MMSLCLQLLFAILLLSHLISAQPSSKILLNENFHSYQTGSNGNPTWSPTKGLWQVIDHTYVQQSDEYDCASLLEFYLNESFTFEITFEHISGELGVGMIFSSSERSSTQYAEMVRFDGASTILTGYFQNGEFNATSSTKSEKIDVKKKHTLLLKVDRDNNIFTLSIDGHILKENLPLTYLAGYCGLQSSGNRVRFHTVKLTRTQMRTKPPDMNWVKQFTLSPTKELVIPNEHKGNVQRYSPLGHLLQEIGTPARSGGQLYQPSAVAFLDSSTLIVTDRGSNQLHLFQINGKWLRSTGWKGKEQAKFDNPIAVSSNGRRQIFVLEKNNNRVQVFNDSLQVITDFGSDKLIEPFDLAIEDSLIYVVNTGLSQIECYTWDGKKARWNNSISYGGGEGRGIGVLNRTIYLSLVNEVRAFDMNGTVLNRFFGRSLNF
ncbi:MAG TPA: NHL repeat-containing protein, partial [Bacteroidota bacterium]|nr:NHL repeat-containing protein [Bacteroidota bacterium]